MQGRQPSITGFEYTALHVGLLAAVRTEARNGTASAVFKQVESIVEPWLRLDVLAGVDPETFASLLTRCWQLEQQLGLHCPSRRFGPALVAGIVFALAVCLGAFLLQGGGRLSAQDLSLTSLWRTLTGHATLALAVIVPVLILGCAYFLTRPSRS